MNVVNLATGGSEDFTYVWENLSNQDVLGSGLSLSINNLNASQTYRCMATDNLCGPISSNLLTVIVYDELLPPTLALISDDVVCAENDGVFIQNLVLPTGGGDNYSYQWFSINEFGPVPINGENDIILNLDNLSVTTQFYLEVTSDYGCGVVSTPSWSVDVLPEVVEPEIDFDESLLPICYGFESPTVFITTPPSGADENWTFTWHTSELGSPFSIVSFNEEPLNLGEITQTTELYARATSDFGCGTYYTDTLTIDVLNEIIPGIISEDQLICYNTVPVALQSTNATGATNEFSVQWYGVDGGVPYTLGDDPESQSLPQLTDSTEYYAVYSSDYGCGDVFSNSISINVLPDLEQPILVPSESGAICFNEGITVNAVGVIDYPWLTYEWMQMTFGLDPTLVGEDEQHVDLNNLIEDFSLELTISSDYGCGSVLGFLNDVDVLNPLIEPTINFVETPENPICFGFDSPVIEILTYPTGGGEVFSSSWAVGETEELLNQVGIDSPLFLDNEIVESDFFVQYQSSDDFGCGSLGSNVLFIDVFEEYMIQDNPISSTVCDDEIISNTSVNVQGAGDDYTYQWYATNDGDFNPIEGASGEALANYDPEESESYFVEITSNFGCGILYSDTIDVTVLEPIVPGELTFENFVLCATETLVYSTSQASGGTNNFLLTWNQLEDQSSWVIESPDINYQIQDVQSTFSGYVEYQDACGSVYSDTLELIVNPLPENPSLIGELEVCNNSIDNYYDIDMPQGPWLYSWTVENGVITSGETMEGILVDWNEGELFSSLDLTVTNFETNCSSSNTWEIFVNDIEAPPASLVVKKPEINVLVSADSTECASYIWGRVGVNNGYVEMFEDRTEQYAFFPNLDTINHHYFVDVTYNCNDITTCPTRNYYLHDPFLHVIEDEIGVISAYPNPSNGVITIEVPNFEYWSLCYLNGSEVENGQINSRELLLNISEPGVYIFRAWNSRNYATTKLIILD